MRTHLRKKRAKAAAKKLLYRFELDTEALRDTPGSRAKDHTPDDLRKCLEAMGSKFAAFGRYLSGRIDLLSWPECQELALIADDAQPMSRENVSAIFAHETGVPPDRAFLQFETQPFVSRRRWQAHRAVLGGSAVIVRIARQADQTVEGFDDLLLLEGMFEERGLPAQRFKKAAADFEREWGGGVNLQSDLDGFTVLARDAVADAASPPPLIRHLCTAHVLVYRRFDGIADGDPPSPEQARALALAWLRSALDGQIFPVNPEPASLGVMEDGRIIFASGPFATLSEQRGDALRTYLAAMAAQDFSQAYPPFLQAVGPARSESQSAELRRQFLQMVAFRDGFRTGGALPRFAEETLIHWRMATQHALPDEGVTAFYRGLFQLARTTAKMAPGRDVLLEALYDLRVRSMFGQARDLFRPAELAGLMEQYATALLTSPEHLDRVLTSVSAGGIPERQTTSAEGPRERFRTGPLLLAFAAAILLLSRVTASAHSVQMDCLAAVVLVGFGSLILRIGGRN